MNQTSTIIKNHQLGSDNTKNKILRYLYNHVNLNYRQEMIANEKDLDNIRDNDYIICPRFSGSRSWIIFIQFGSYYYAVSFPKHSQRKKEELIIHPIDIIVTKEFYHGTIMEGIYYKNDQIKYLIIDEVYMLAGVDQLLKPKDDRLNNLSQYLRKDTRTKPNYYIYVSQFFYINKKNLIELYHKIKTDAKIQEIIFYPINFGMKIFSYTIINSDLIDNIVKISKFRLQKTASPDVYNLLPLNSNCKIDIAYIPDIKTSKKCKQWFKDKKTKEVLAKCQLHIENNKWIPIELFELDVL